MLCRMEKLLMDDETKRQFIKDEAAKLARIVAKQLRQEYVKHIDGVWWLWTLGRPIRPLTLQEFEEALERGDIHE